MKNILLLPALLLAFTACTGNVSFNEDEIQEIAKSQPEGGFEILLQGPQNIDSGEPLFVFKHKSSELNDEQRSRLKEKGYKLIKSGEYEEYTVDLDEKSGFASIDPESISSIEILKDITPEISERYGEGSESGVVIITMKDESTRNMVRENK